MKVASRAEYEFDGTVGEGAGLEACWRSLASCCMLARCFSRKTCETSG